MTQELGLGGACGSAFGEHGITKRLTALAALAALKGGRLLDIGCGPGSYTVRLAEHFERVDAIDIEPERLADFRATLDGTDLASRITVHEMDAAQLDCPDATFDVVTAIEVLEHVSDLDATLAEVRRVLRRGGLFALTTPNRWFPFETHGIIVRGRRVPPAKAPFVTWLPPLHRRVADARAFTRRTLYGPIRRAGFEVTGSSYMYPPFDRSGLGRRVRPVTDRLESTPLRVFGMTHVAVCTAT